MNVQGMNRKTFVASLAARLYVNPPKRGVEDRRSTECAVVDAAVGLADYLEARGFAPWQSEKPASAQPDAKAPAPATLYPDEFRESDVVLFYPPNLEPHSEAWIAWKKGEFSVTGSPDFGSFAPGFRQSLYWHNPEKENRPECIVSTVEVSRKISPVLLRAMNDILKRRRELGKIPPA
jgi:hypothetical protein